MKINHIKINSYGKLYQKEIDFDKVNLIYGKNESGKSTLLNFINDIFYNNRPRTNNHIVTNRNTIRYNTTAANKNIVSNATSAIQHYTC